VSAQIWKAARPKPGPDGANAHGRHDPPVTLHANFLSLGRDAEPWQGAYRERARQAISDDELTAIRLHLQRQHALVRIASVQRSKRNRGDVAARRRPIVQESARKLQSDPAFGFWTEGWARTNEKRRGLRLAVSHQAAVTPREFPEH
jgi:hypothetical protein